MEEASFKDRCNMGVGTEWLNGSHLTVVFRDHVGL